MALLDPFQYNKLDTAKSTIRLLELLPRASDGVPRCRLKHVTFLEHIQIKYTALSYTWGSPEDTESIIVNDKRLEVRRNLWNFLHYLQITREAPGQGLTTRDPSWPPERPNFRFSIHKIHYPLWIDAICIDQSNVQEKNHQVQLMKDIYENASHVLVWLGVGDETVETLIKVRDWAIETFAVEKSFEKLAWRHRPDVINESRALDDVPKWCEAKEYPLPSYPYGADPQPPVTSADISNTMELLCKNNYWDRLWIVQELALAAELAIIIRDQIIPWKVWMDMLSMLIPTAEKMHSWAGVEMSQWALTANDSIVSTFDRQALGPSPRRYKGYSFEDLVAVCSTKACADIRDRVFGLLGLVQAKRIGFQKPEKPFPNDYNDSIVEIFYKALQYFTPLADGDEVDMVHIADLFCKALHLNGQDHSSLVVQFGDYKKSKHFHIPASIFVNTMTFLEIIYQGDPIRASYLNYAFVIREVVLCGCRYCERYLGPGIEERLLKRDRLERLWLCIPVGRTSLAFIFESQGSVREYAFLAGAQIFCIEKTAILLIHGHLSQAYGLANLQTYTGGGYTGRFFSMVITNMQLIHDAIFNYARDYPSTENLDRSWTKPLWRYSPSDYWILPSVYA